MSDIFVPGTEKPEALYEELDQLGRELGIPVPQVHLGLVVTDADGNVLDEYSGRSRTWNRNFWNHYFVQVSGAPSTTSMGAFGAGSLKVRDTSGTSLNSTNYCNSAAPFNYNWSISATSTQGIVVGSGTTAESFEHNTLATLITHGTGAGQLTYTSQTNPVAVYDSGTKTWATTHRRSFSNGSGGAISVNEAGYYTQFMSAYNLNYNMMICRDVLPSTIVVPNGAMLTVHYTISLGFPA
jgi:hypothetical protein